MLFRVTLIAAVLAGLTVVSGSLLAQDASEHVAHHQTHSSGSWHYLRSDSLIVARVKDSNEFLAYGKSGGNWNAFTFPQGVKATPVIGNHVCAFNIEGEQVTEIVAVDILGNWRKSKLPAPAKKCLVIHCAMLILWVGRA